MDNKEHKLVNCPHCQRAMTELGLAFHQCDELLIFETRAKAIDDCAFKIMKLRKRWEGKIGKGALNQALKEIKKLKVTYE